MWVLESGKYIFHGRVQLVQDPFQQDQKDSEGTLRKVWIFPVKVVDSNDVIGEQFIREGKTKNTLTAHIVEKQRLQE